MNDVDPAVFDEEAFPDRNMITDENEVARYEFDPTHGLINGYDMSKKFNEQGPYDKIIGFGARSWTALDARTGEKVTAGALCAS